MAYYVRLLPNELHDISSCTDENQQQLRKLILIDFTLGQYPSAQNNGQNKNLVKRKVNFVIGIGPLWCR